MANSKSFTRGKASVITYDNKSAGVYLPPQGQHCQLFLEAISNRFGTIKPYTITVLNDEGIAEHGFIVRGFTAAEAKAIVEYINAN